VGSAKTGDEPPRVVVGTIEKEEGAVFAKEMALEALQVVGIRVANGAREHAMFDGPGGAIKVGENLTVAFKSCSSVLTKSPSVGESL
jgi:hypothetical protein